MAGTYNYSLIRVVPDRRRGEWLNIGVVVYHVGRLDVRLLANMSKVRILAPTLDMGFLDNLAAGWQQLCEKLETAEERCNLLAHFPIVHTSALGQFVADAQSYESRVTGIMRDLVAPPPQPRDDTPVTRLETQLRNIFRRGLLLGSKPGDIARHLVVPKFPVDREANLVADFALRNGAMRLTETIDFRVKPEQIRSVKRGQAALKAVTLNRAAEVFAGNCVPSVVYAANPETLDLAQHSLALLGNYAERIYDASNPHDMSDYMTMMHKAAEAAGGA